MIMLLRTILLLSISIIYLNAFAAQQGIGGTPAKLYNGAVTEGFVNEYMKSNGWSQINAEVGRNGIDGLFSKKVNGKMEYRTIESKFNNAKQGATINGGRQAGDPWHIEKIDKKITNLKKKLSISQLSKSEINNINKEIDRLNGAKNAIVKGEYKSSLYKLKPLSEEYSELKKLKKLTPEQINRLKELEALNEKGRLNSSYRSALYDLDSNGKITGEAKRMGMHNQIIDLKKQYKPGSPELKQQKILKHSIRREHRLVKESTKLKAMQNESKKLKKGTVAHSRSIDDISKQNKKISTIRNSKPKNISRASTMRRSSLKMASNIGTKSVAKAGVKGAIKGAGLSILSKLPIIGIGAQIAMDAYMFSELEAHGVEIENNKNNIDQNRQLITVNSELIDRLQGEQEILNININQNTHNINQIVQQLFVHNEEFKTINNELVTISTQLTNVNALIDKNSKEIADIKNGTFDTALQKVDEYYKSEKNKNTYLNQAIYAFDHTNNIKNENVKHIAYHYLTILRYEQYLKIQDYHDIDEVANSFNNLVNFAKSNLEYLSLVNSTYLAIGDLDGHLLEPMKKQLEALTKDIVDQKLEAKLFDDAVTIAGNYANIMQEDEEDNEIYILSIKAKKDNFNKLKDFASVSKTLKIIQENQNSLLNEKAVRYLYSEGSLENAKKLLKSKRYDKEEFRIKAFAYIYNYLGDKDKLDALNHLVQTNSTYSSSLKSKMEEIMKSKR